MNTFRNSAIAITMLSFSMICSMPSAEAKTTAHLYVPKTVQAGQTFTIDAYGGSNNYAYKAQLCVQKMEKASWKTLSCDSIDSDKSKDAALRLKQVAPDTTQVIQYRYVIDVASDHREDYSDSPTMIKVVSPKGVSAAKNPTERSLKPSVGPEVQPDYVG